MRCKESDEYKNEIERKISVTSTSCARKKREPSKARGAFSSLGDFRWVWLGTPINILNAQVKSPYKLPYFVCHMEGNLNHCMRSNQDNYFNKGNLIFDDQFRNRRRSRQRATSIPNQRRIYIYFDLYL